MNKKIKMLTTALLLSGSLLSVVPAHAATTTEKQTKKASAEASINKIDKKVTKPSGSISVKSNDPFNITKHNVRLRRKPNFNSTVLELLNPGDDCRFIDMAGEWVHIGYNSPEGYIYGYIYIGE